MFLERKTEQKNIGLLQKNVLTRFCVI